MKIIIKIVLLTLLFSSIDCITHNDLIMRDIVLLIDNSETVAKIFRNNDYNPGFAFTDTMSDTIYNQTSPIITTSAALKNFCEHAEFFSDMLNYHKYPKIIGQKYITGEYQSTELSNPKMLHEFSLICKAIYESWININEQIKELFDKKYKIEDIAKIISNRLKNYAEQHLEEYLSFSQRTTDLWSLAIELLKFYIMFETIKTQNWDVRKLNNSVVLMIPLRYLNPIEAQILDFFKQQNIRYTIKDGYDIDEVILGLQYKHFIKITSPFSSKSYHYRQHEYKTDVEKNFLSTLSTVFLTKTPGTRIFKDLLNITDKKLEDFPQHHYWNIIADSHGSKTFTAGMPNEMFLNFLNFCNWKINTHVLYYTSCGAGETIQQFNISNQKYVLILGSITSATTVRTRLPLPMPETKYRSRPILASDLNSTQKSLAIKSNYNFARFFELQRKYTDFTPNALEHLAIWSRRIENRPQIRFPNTEWFTLANLSRTEFVLNQFLIDLHDQNSKPIIITKKEFVFLYSQPFYKLTSKSTLNISPKIIIKETMPKFIPMTPNNSTYNFNLIDARDFTLTETILAFTHLYKTSYKREFYIKELVISNPRTLAKSEQTDNDLSDKNLLNSLFSRNIIDTDTITLQKVIINFAPKDSPNFIIDFEYDNRLYTLKAESYAQLEHMLTPEGSPKVIVSRNYSPDERSIKRTSPFEAIEQVLKRRRITQNINTLRRLSYALTRLATL